MIASNQAVISIRRPGSLTSKSLRSFVVRIDGRRAGKIQRGAVGEFAVEPGEHTVVVSLDWVKTLPLRVDVAAGSRTDLIIAARVNGIWRMLPMIVGALIAAMILNKLSAEWAPVGESYLLRMGIFAGIYMLFCVGYVLVTSAISREFWALWKLELVAKSGTTT